MERVSVDAVESTTVGAGEAIRFAPGEFQSGRNETDGDLLAFAIGAPRDSEDVRIPVECPECGHDDLRVTLGEETRTVVVCRGCGTDFEEPPLRN